MIAGHNEDCHEESKEGKSCGRPVDEKEIVKVWSNAHISKAIFDWSLFTASPTHSTVLHPIFRFKGKDYIGVRENILNGEVITVGKLQFKYFVLGNKKLFKDGRIANRIERVDGYSMANLDVTNSKVGSLILINRLSVDKILDLHNNI